MLVGQLLLPYVRRDSTPATASWARTWPVPPEESSNAQTSPLPGDGGVSISTGDWYRRSLDRRLPLCPSHPRMKMMWIRSPALNEHVGTFSNVSPSLNLPKGTASVWLKQVGEDLPMVARSRNEIQKGTGGCSVGRETKS